MCLEINFNTLMSLLPVMLVRWYLCIPMMAMEANRQLDRDTTNVVIQSGIAGTNPSSLTIPPQSIRIRGNVIA
jgi:hypothetical protein